MTRDDVLKLIEDGFKSDRPPTEFPSVEAAVDIAVAALRYLTDKCEDEDGPEDTITD